MLPRSLELITDFETNIRSVPMEVQKSGFCQMFSYRFISQTTVQTNYQLSARLHPKVDPENSERGAGEIVAELKPPSPFPSNSTKPNEKFHSKMVGRGFPPKMQGKRRAASSWSSRQNFWPAYHVFLDLKKCSRMACVSRNPISFKTFTCST